jgi:small GTP-binding protein
MVPLAKPPSSNGMDYSLIFISYINDQFPEEHVPTVLDCYRTEVNIDNRALTL